MNCFGSIIKTQSGQNYVYNTATNQIITIDNDWYYSLPDDEKERLVFDALGENGIEVEGMPEQINWSLDSENYLKSINEELPAMILEITQECTLRCEYCVFSGNYKNMRSHSRKHMDWAMIKRCIDFYAEHSKALDTAQISFYGGEALLHFDLIKAAVEYASKVFVHKNLSFRISSNGTTLTEPVLKWLNERDNVSVAITVNGITHDKYRKFPSGKGSLKIIESVINRIKSRYPQLWERINFIANVASLQELVDLKEYYSKYIGKPPLLITGIIKYGGNDTIQKIVHTKDSKEIENEVYNLLYDKQDDYIMLYYGTDLYEMANRRIGKDSSEHLGISSCMPFTSGLFVSATGEFGICEKAGADSKLGDIQNGYHIPYIHQLIKDTSNFLNEKCRKCWCHKLCSMCFKDFIVSETNKITLAEGFCSDMRAKTKEKIRMFCELAERNPEAVSQLSKAND